MTRAPFSELAVRLRPKAVRGADSSGFLTAAIVMTAVVVAGFAQSYFFRPLFPPQESLSALVQLHGALMTAWIGLFVAQVILVLAGRTALHRRLGRLGPYLLGLIVAAALPMILIATRLGGNHMPGPALPALALVLGFLLTFIALAGVALLFTRRPDIHKRLMLVATLVAVEAGTSRVPVEFLGTLWRVHLANDSLLFVFVLHDTIKNRRLHPAFLWGTLSVVGMQVLTAWLSGTGAWLAIAHRIVQLI